MNNRTTNSAAKRSPLHKRSVRRLPGQGLADKLADERFAPIAIWLGMSAGLLVATVVDLSFRWSNHEPMGWHMPVMLAIGLAMAAWSIARIMKLARRERLGLEGEISVAQTLESLGRLGYRVLHDLQPDPKSTRGANPDGSGPNIDHVIVGPAGVFVIETKVRRKRIKDAKDAVVRYDGSQVWVDSPVPDQRPVIQARAAAADVGRFLTEIFGRTPPIRAVVLFPGWFIKNDPNLRNPEVWVLSDTAFPKWVENAPADGPALDDASVQRITEALASRCQRPQPMVPQ